MQAFYLAAAQGLIAMFVGRGDNGSAAVWGAGKLALVRVAAAISRHRAQRLSRQDPENGRTEWVSKGAAASEDDASAGGKGKCAVDGAGGVELMAGGVELQVLEQLLDLFYRARDAVRSKNQPRIWRDSSRCLDVISDVESTEMQAAEEECSAVLAELGRLDPQYHMAGMQNVWIIKASNSSKGVGIKLFDKLSQVNAPPPPPPPSRRRARTHASTCARMHAVRTHMRAPALGQSLSGYHTPLLCSMHPLSTVLCLCTVSAPGERLAVV